MKIQLRNSTQVALIDERDSHQAKHSWSWHDVLGVVRYDATQYDAKEQRTPHLLLHREITKAPAKHFVVHINGDRLDNRRKNLLLLSRKPSPAMIHEAMEHFNISDPQKVLYVGDRPEDEEAARRAGVRFHRVKDGISLS